MALYGTLDDFGLVNAFQIIGQTNKTGALTIEKRDNKVRIYFQAGAIVDCEVTHRDPNNFLGNMLLRAEVLTQAQLDAAVAEQKASQKRLGDCLVEVGAIHRADLAEFMRLQTSETVFRVFLWRSGTYQFSASQEVPVSHAPIKADSLLMEGFRQADQWPDIRKKIPNYGCAFTIKQDLDAFLAKSAIYEVDAEQTQISSKRDTVPDSMDSFDDFNVEEDAAAQKNQDTLSHIQNSERIVYSLIQPKRDVQKIIDLARIGEFETCAALVNLLDANIIAIHIPPEVKASAKATVGGIFAGRRHVGQFNKIWSIRSFGVTGMLGVALGLTCLIALSGLSVFEQLTVPEQHYVELSLEHVIHRGELAQIHEALAIYQILRGSYPDKLDALAEMGLVSPHSLSSRWHEKYAYMRGDNGYTLLAPLH